MLTSGVFVKNIALCFGGDTNAAVLAALLRRDGGQTVWSCSRAQPAGRVRPGAGRAELAAARAAVAEAYQFLVETWEPGDRLFLFGAGRGAACARALARLLGTFGVLGDDVPGWTVEDFREYVLATYAMPRTRRDNTDWEHVGRLAAEFSGGADLAVAVEYLGLWDTFAVPGLPRPQACDPTPNVLAARHAVAIDGHGHRGPQLLDRGADRVQEVWFRGAHCDVAGEPGACSALSGIALDWILDGAVRAGAAVCEPPCQLPPHALDALAGSAHIVAFRKVPADAAVHASVACFLRAHPSYWHRLPAHVVWADLDWVARSERLIPVPAPPPNPAPEIPALATAG